MACLYVIPSPDFLLFVLLLLEQSFTLGSLPLQSNIPSFSSSCPETTGSPVRTSGIKHFWRKKETPWQWKEDLAGEIIWDSGGRRGGVWIEKIKAGEERGSKGRGDEKQEQNCGGKNKGNTAAAPKSLETLKNVKSISVHSEINFCSAVCRTVCPNLVLAST